VSQSQYALLVVDDNEDNRYTLTQRLKRQGYTNLTTAKEGQEALDLLRCRHFDLVLLDIMMPALNGYEVLEQLKADATLRHIPVIMISAVDELESVIRCIELGAEDYLPKPFNPTLLKARIGACLEKKRLRDEGMRYLAQIEGELKSARDIQLSMVPTVYPPPTPECPVEIFALLDPARQVGGDLYDFFYTGECRLWFLIGDVSDKGVPAALFMARTKSMVRMVASLLRMPDGGPPTPHDIMMRVNDELCRDNGMGMFVTLLLGMLDPATGELYCCNAGHPLPYLLGRSGVEPLKIPRGIPLGIHASSDYASFGGALSRGEGLFLFTDGVTEAVDDEGGFFTEARLEAVLRAVATENSETIIAAVVAKVREFTAGVPQSDDVTALALRFGL
jgi:sigma-B regulation protein RsbU (phosphoserine phosphatase)